jgi:hypothetical protein
VYRLEASSIVDDVQDRGAFNIYNIHENSIVKLKLITIPNSKFKVPWRVAVFLAKIVKSSNLFNRFCRNIVIAGSF